MRVIHAEIEQTYENAAVKLIVDRMLNQVRELELNTADIVGNEKAKEMMNARPELEINSAEAAAYFNNYENVDEDMDFEKNTAVFPTSDVDAYINVVDIVVAVAKKCIKCWDFWKCKRIC